MTSKLTREENVQAVFDLKAGYTLGLADVEILKRVARMALAAMDSDPVAEVLSNRPGNDTSIIDRALPVGTQLYRHAQPVPVVSEVSPLVSELPAPVVMDDIKLRELFDSWFASDCSFDRSPEASEEDNIAWRESYWYVWQRCRTAILQAQSGDDGEPTDDERIMAIEGIHNCERCGDQGWIVGEMGITRCACGQAGNSPVIPEGESNA